MAADGDSFNRKRKIDPNQDEGGPSKLPREKPLCVYGSKCYRRNPYHLAEFSHPDIEGNVATKVVVINSATPVNNLQNTLNNDRVPEVSVAQHSMSSQNENSGSTRSVHPKLPVTAIQPPSTKPSQNSLGSMSLGFAARLQAAHPYYFFLTKVKSSKPTHQDQRSIAFHDLLDKSLGNLDSSLQLNFMVDVEWLLAQYEWRGLNKKPLTIWYDSLEGGPLPDNVVAYKAAVPSAFGHHHTKMSFFYYDDNSMRVVVSTANLIESDWENRTQGVWVSPSCPKLSTGPALQRGESRSGFKQALIHYLLGYNLSYSRQDDRNNFKLWYDRVLETDFSNINVCLVTSVPKTHSGSDFIKRFGHRRMADLLKTHASVAQASWPVVGQASSIGSLGPAPSAWLTSQLVASFSHVKSSLPQTAPFKFIYPSFQNVVDSYDGLLGGACLPYRRQTHVKQPWLVDYMHQWKSETRDRSRAVPHIKTYTRISLDGKKAAWFLVTSANLSKAAWGTVNKDGSGLYVMSYEAGVLFLPSLVLGNNATEFDLQGSNSFTLPYDLPLTTYTSSDTPWFSELLDS